jgi:hypothetical protein
MLAEENDAEKLNRLLCEHAIAEMSLAFLLTDYDYYEESVVTNTLIENACFESTTIEKIPQSIKEQITFMEHMISDLETSIHNVNESYFTANGGPSKIVAKSIGSTASDDRTSSKKENDPEKEAAKVYTPMKNKEESDETEDDSEDDSDDDEESKKRAEAKKRRDEKYLNSDTDADFDKLVSEKYEEIEKPQKRNIFQRIQNKALDANVQFKKKVAEGRRNAMDARNAGKAVAKIPTSVTDSIKKTVDEWDELDDNRRKEYIIKPGVRKKYFKALKICIMHYGAFAINPVLNIVLAICQRFSHTKDIRIRNELTRELKAEIKVTEEKIEDAKANGDNKQKYQLMRIRDKLEAELIRVGGNAKFI